MSQGLPRQIKLVFILQTLISSLLIALGIVAIGLAVDRVVVLERMQREVGMFEEGRRADPAHPLPRTSTINGYLDDGTGASLPKGLRGLPPGFHWRPFRSMSTYVKPRSGDTLYLSFDASFLGRAIILTGLGSLLLSLLTISLISRLSYRTSKRLVLPVNWLANIVSRWDPRAPETQAIAPTSLPVDSGREVRELARALSGLADRVGEFVARERDFTRDASHELRTPLTVIRVATDLMLADPQTSSQAQRSLVRVQRAGRDMEAVIEAFLILAREAEIEPQSEEFDVADVVHHEVERVRPLLAGRPVKLQVIDEARPKLYAPPNVLNVMLGNLLSNATRFTDEGLIEVKVCRNRLDIRDTGIGMSPEALARVFDPFYRVDPGRQEGKGMGLSIVRRLGDRFGWPVSLQSTPGKGTTATIRFGG